MVLLGIVLGLGVGGIDRMDPGARGLQNSVEAFVQSSRDRARASGQRVLLRFVEPDPDTGLGARLERLVFRRRWEANFETAFSGRENVQLAGGAALDRPGRYGAGLDVTQGGSATLAGRGGTFASPEGVQIEFDFRVDEMAAGQLFEWEDLGSVRLRRDGSLQWRAVYGDGQSWADQDLPTPAGLVRQGRWHHLRAIAVPGRMEVFLDGRRVAEREAFGQLQQADGAPFLSDPDGDFLGAFDEFAAWGRALEVGPELNADQELYFGATEVVFDRFGRLDGAVHSEPVEVRIASLGTEAGAFQIGVFTEEVLR